MKWLVISIGLFTWLSACSSHKNDLTTDVGTMAEGERLREDGFYDEARKQYYRIKTEFPQSILQIQADLKIAESYYDEESYPAAANSYEEFLKTYPGRPEIPEALYHLGLCYVQQMPSTPQRDTRSSAKVIDTFTRLLVDYPQHERAADAQKYVEKGRDQLAEKTFQIAKFYERRGHPDSAARRFKDFIDQFLGHPLYEEAYAHMIKNLREAERPEEAQKRSEEFQEKFPNSKFRSMIAK